MKLIRIVKRCSCQKKILKIAGSNRNGPNIRSAYLVTYSQVAETWTRETFAKAVVSLFSRKSPGKRDTFEHIILDLLQKRWLRVRNELVRVEGITF